VIKSASAKAMPEMPLGCCGASKNPVAKRDFPAHSEFKSQQNEQQFIPCVLRSANAFSTLRATGGSI
jgi:hypothetical protein